MTTVDSLPRVRARIRARLSEIESRASRMAKLDIGARMNAIRSKVAAAG
jgi:hypothetical protein